MDRSARLFLCARCRDQVLLCSHCDRGQQYCGRTCSGICRRERRRETARRYQSSARGQLKHAARTARWRERQRRSLRAVVADGAANKVTHQGCADGGVHAPLIGCDPPPAAEANTDTASLGEGAPSRTGPTSFAPLRCRRCSQLLLPHVRLGYRRHASPRQRTGHDHSS